jgi:hypothetical protein
VAPVGEARLTQLQVVRTESPTFDGTSFGSVGQYEKIVYRATGAVDPALPGNALITDIQGAPRNAQGLVEYSMDVMVVKPIDPSKGSGKIFYDRGETAATTCRSRRSSKSPRRRRPATTNAAGAGTGLLMRRGDTLVWSGWEDTRIIGTSANLFSATLPIAKNPDGSPLSRI